MGCSVIAVIVVGVLIATFIHLKARSRRRQYREDYFKVGPGSFICALTFADKFDSSKRN